MLQYLSFLRIIDYLRYFCFRLVPFLEGWQQKTHTPRRCHKYWDTNRSAQEKGKKCTIFSQYLVRGSKEYRETIETVEMRDGFEKIKVRISFVNRHTSSPSKRLPDTLSPSIRHFT